MRPFLASECVQWNHGLETLNLPQNPTETKVRGDRLFTVKCS
jgi:hypothetical protein